MNLKQLKEIVDFQYNKSKIIKEDIQVVITLKDPSVGGRAFSSITDINMGIDWESNELRIEPKKRLFSEENRMSSVKPVIEKEFNNRKYHVCPNCLQKIIKSDCFCRYCGQKLNK